MATKTISANTDIAGDGSVRSITWESLANGDDGTPAEWVQYADRSFQVVGTFGAGGNCRIEGSNDGTNWAPLTDPQGNDMNISSAKIEQAEEITRYVRPRVTAGDGTTALVVTLIMRRANPMRS